LMWLVDANGNVKFSMDDIQSWWGIDFDRLEYNQAPNSGANSTIDVGMGVGVYKEQYAIVVRGGTKLDLRQGTAGVDSDTNGTTNGIGFRVATDYIP